MRLFLEQSIWQWVVLYTLFRLVAYVASTKRAGEGRGAENVKAKVKSENLLLSPQSLHSVRELWDSGVGKICNFVRKRRSHLGIDNFWVPKTLTFNEAKCISNLVKMSFICMRMKNPFHIKGWPLNLDLIQRPRKLTRPSFFSFLIWRIGCVPREICFNQSWTLLGSLESSDVISWGNQWRRHEISPFLVSGYN